MASTRQLMATSPPDFRADSLSALFFSLFISVGLFGGLTVQAVIYYNNFRDDKMTQKYIIGAIWVLNVLIVSFSAASAYDAMISGFTDIDSVGQIPLSTLWKVAKTCESLTVSLIHILHLRRMWILYQRERIIPSIASAIVGINMSFCVASGVQLFAIDMLANFSSAAAWTLTAYFASTALADISITAALCYYLGRSKRSIMSSGTQSTIAKLTRWLLWSGASSCAWSIASLITFFASPGTLFVLLPLSWSALYANSFLAMTLSRTRLRERSAAQSDHLEAWSVSGIEFARSVEHDGSNGDCEMSLECGEAVSTPAAMGSSA